jgi:hypothetical protein
VKSEWLTCRICEAKLKFMKYDISAHLKTAHAMDLDTYEAKFMKVILYSFTNLMLKINLYQVA